GRARSDRVAVGRLLRRRDAEVEPEVGQRGARRVAPRRDRDVRRPPIDSSSPARAEGACRLRGLRPRLCVDSRAGPPAEQAARAQERARRRAALDRAPAPRTDAEGALPAALLGGRADEPGTDLAEDRLVTPRIAFDPWKASTSHTRATASTR